MSWPVIVMYGVAVSVGFPAMFRNLTAAALFIGWLVGEIVYLRTGNNLMVSAHLMVDIGVISVICARATIREGCRTYPTLRTQLKCGALAITVYDWLIIGIYLLAVWPIYVSDLHEYYKWWYLWALTILQFLIAGIEALTLLLGRRKGRIMFDPPRGPDGLALAGRWSNG